MEMATAATGRAHGARPETGGGRAGSRPRLGGRLVWLSYLALYFTPWLFSPPSPQQALAGLMGVGAFLAIYAHGLRPRRSYLSHALASAAVGFALGGSGGAWSVFNVYAAAFAARSHPRRAAAILFAALQLALVAYGLLTRQPWLNWGSGLFFGVVIGLGVLWQSDLEEKNRRLEQAQGEVHALATAAERERIARDLHDLLGHTLTVVAIKAELAERLCERDVEAARREMHDLAAIARDALAEVRAAVTGMRGASLAAEMQHAERALAAAGVRARLSLTATGSDPQREAVITMALREAVTNVIRHARATSCVVVAEDAAGGGLRLSVDDDGCGGEVREGSGLSGMRARLEAAGGALALGRAEAGGLRLVASLPAAPRGRA